MTNVWKHLTSSWIIMSLCVLKSWTHFSRLVAGRLSLWRRLIHAPLVAHHDGVGLWNAVVQIGRIHLCRRVVVLCGLQRCRSCQHGWTLCHRWTTSRGCSTSGWRWGSVYVLWCRDRWLEIWFQLYWDRTILQWHLQANLYMLPSRNHARQQDMGLLCI